MTKAKQVKQVQLQISVTYIVLLPSLMICLAATVDDRWIGSMKMLSVSVPDITEYLPTNHTDC